MMSHNSLRFLRIPQAPVQRIFLSQSRTILPRNRKFLPGRPASTSTAESSSLVTRLKNVFYVHRWLVVPALRWLYPDAEDGHHAGTKSLKALYSLGLHPRERKYTFQQGSESDLSVTVFGQRLENPIGTSAGIDKLAEVPDALMALGPAIVEVGGATPLPQDGNPRPRVFRLPSQRALINRYGLNSKGADDMARRLRERVRIFAFNNGLGVGEEAERAVLNGAAGVPPGSLMEGKLLAVQVAKNKDTKDEDIDAVRRDYVYCVERLAPYADILVVNVSSPNTPGLRTLQRVEPLTKILEGVVGAAKRVDRKTKPKVMVKVSPDEDQDEQIEGIVEAIWRSGVDGVIVGNTTKRRDNLLPPNIKLSAKEQKAFSEQGGFSGPQMFDRTLGLVRRYRRLLDQGPSPPPQENSFAPQEQSPPPREKQEGEHKPHKAISGLATGDEPASTITEKFESLDESRAEQQKASDAATHEPKVIFATGGITNGKQALEILNAGANVAQVYSALIYGGVGTISRIKREMSDEIKGTKSKKEDVE